jgi:hypothetical protein
MKKPNITDAINMKKILIISPFLILLMISNQLKAQYPHLEIKVTTVNESAAGKADAEIHITTEGEKPPYIYQVFDKAPWNGGKELAKSEKTNEIQYVFKNLTPGTYFVCATDNEENSDCKIILINND